MNGHFPTERSKQDFDKVLNSYLRNLETQRIILTPEQRAELVEGLFRTYYDYQKAEGHHFPRKGRLTPLQVLAWAPFVLIRNHILQDVSYQDLIITASISLEDLLKETKVIFENQKLLESIQHASLRLALNHDIPIWEMPLYFAMATANTIRPPYPWLKWLWQLRRLPFPWS